MMEFEFELENIHLLALFCTALIIVVADHEGFLYMRGKKRLLNSIHTKFFHNAVWIGLAVLMVTGILLALPAWKHYLTEPAFLLKMLFVAILVGNGAFIGRLMSIASEKPFQELTAREKSLLFVSGALSTTGWAGATLIGFFFL